MSILPRPTDAATTSAARAYDLHPNELTDTFVARFHGRYEAASPEACWLWLGAKLPKGYGMTSLGTRPNRRRFLAHRVAWVLGAGKPLTGGVTIDHLCHQPSCVNPAHLEPVSLQENGRRGRQRQLSRAAL